MNDLKVDSEIEEIKEFINEVIDKVDNPKIFDSNV